MWNQRFHDLKAGYASSIKQHEIGMINYAMVCLSRDKFQLVYDVKYLWVITKNEVAAEPGEIYIGVENPLDYPQAFHEGIQDYLKLYPTMTKACFFERGHATLAIRYDEKGNAKPTQAYMGGELYFKNGNWYLNNRSGRFYHIQEGLSFQELNLLLELVAQQFFIHTQNKNNPGIKPVIEVITNSKSADYLWKKHINLGVTLPNIAIMIILKSLKINIQSRLDSENNNEIRPNKTPEYLAIQSALYEKNFTDLTSVVDYLVQNEFIQRVKSIFDDHHQVFTKELETTLRNQIEFLKSKIDEKSIPSESLKK